MCDTLCEGGTEGVVEEEDGREEGDSLWGSSLVRSSPGHRGVERPTSETRDPIKEAFPQGPAGTVGEKDMNECDIWNIWNSFNMKYGLKLRENLI